MNGVIKTRKLTDPSSDTGSKMWHKVYDNIVPFYKNARYVLFDQVNQTKGKEFCVFRGEKRRKRK